MRIAVAVLATTVVALVSLPCAGEEPSEPSGEEPSTKPAASPTSAEGSSVPTDDDDEEPLPPPFSPERDTLGGHLTISALAGVVSPFGQLHEGMDLTDVLGTGLGGGLEAGYGVSRTVVVGLWGHGARFRAGNTCANCSATSFAVGPFIRYHLVQGVRFDPWISAGLGYRMTKIDAGVATLKYSGFDFLRAQAGGDWYALPQLGLGPFLELDVGMYTRRPDDLSPLDQDRNAGKALAFAVGCGLRVTFDTPGK